ncbi:MAG: zinc ribbon domain-containing protein [Dehalococcoidia bacterium]
MSAQTHTEASTEVPVFSERLSTVLEGVLKGEAPNAGYFCGYCYTPMARKRKECANCGTAVRQRKPVEQVPDDVLAMFRSMRRRESMVVNGFAYLGLMLGVVIFIAVFYVLFLKNANVWWYVFDIALLFVLARVLAGLLGGFWGDEVGFNYSRRKLTEDWQAYEAAKGGAGDE